MHKRLLRIIGHKLDRAKYKKPKKYKKVEKELKRLNKKFKWY